MVEAVVEELNLEYTPTWVAALVCFSIISISLLVGRCLRYVGKVGSCKLLVSIF